MHVELIRDLIVDHLNKVLEQKQKDIEVTYINLEFEENEEETVHIKIDYYDKTSGQYYYSISNIDLNELQSKGGN